MSALGFGLEAVYPVVRSIEPARESVASRLGIMGELPLFFSSHKWW